MTTKRFEYDSGFMRNGIPILVAGQTVFYKVIDYCGDGDLSRGWTSSARIEVIDVIHHTELNKDNKYDNDYFNITGKQSDLDKIIKGFTFVIECDHEYFGFGKFHKAVMEFKRSKGSSSRLDFDNTTRQNNHTTLYI